MDVSSSATWVSLGKLIPTVQQLDASELSLQDPKPVQKEHPTACIMGKRYTRKQCFLRALELDNDDHEAWFLLGKCIEDFEQDNTTGQAGPKWSPNPCIEVPTWESPTTPVNPHQYGSLLLERRNVNLYMAAGSDSAVLPRRATRRLYSKQQCYVRALECALVQLRAMTTAAEAKVRAQDGTEGLVVSIPNPAPIWLALSSTLTKVLPKTSHSQHYDPLGDSSSLKPVGSEFDETLPDTVVDAVTVLGATYDKLACAIQAVEADTQLGSAWNAVGVATTRDQPVTLQILKFDEVEDASVPRGDVLTVRRKVGDLGAKKDMVTMRASKLDCFIRALERGEEGNTKVWTNAAAHMGISQVATVVIQGKERTKADCYAMAVKLSDTNSVAWLGLGLSLGAAGTPPVPLSVDIGSVSRLHCLRRAVESDPYNSRAWVDLGIEVATHSSAAATATKGVRILVAERLVQAAKTRNLPCPKTIADPVRRGGFTAKDCYVRALELNSSIAEAWSRLGMVLSGTLTQDAIEGAMNMDVDTRVAEVLRLAKLRRTVEKERKKKLREVEKMKARVDKEIATGVPAEESDEASPPSSSPASDETTESEIADRAAFKEERRWVRNYSRPKVGKAALSGLYTSYSLLETVTVRGRPVTKVDCHLRCLELEPTKSRSWCNMGTGCAYVSSAAKQLDIFIKSWRKDNKDDIETRSEVEEDEATEDANDESDGGDSEDLNQSVVAPTSRTLQHAVMGSLEQELQGVLPCRDGASYSQRRCYIRAVEIDPTASIAWSGLAMTLKLKPVSGMDSSAPIPVVSEILHEDSYKAVIKLDRPLTVDRVDCLLRAASDPNESLRAELWVNLGDCLARPHIDPYSLAVVGYDLDNRIVTVTTSVDLNAVNQPAVVPKAHRPEPFAQRISALHCFCKAIQLDPDNSMAWYRLGLEMLHLQSRKDTQDGAILRATACCSIPMDEVERRLLKGIDAQGGLLVDESVTAVGSLQCFTAAIEVGVSDGLHLSPVKAPITPAVVSPEFNLFGACWTYLGVCLTQGRVSKCKPWKKGSGHSVDRQGAFFQALEFDPHVRLAWRELGEMLVDGWFTYNTVSIRGREYTKKECIEKAQLPK